MELFARLADAARSGEAVALAIIASARGSSPQRAGAKALFYADGRIVGTLGGGCLEAEIQDRARRALRSGEAASFELVLDHDFGWDDGLICGGRVAGLILPRAAEAGSVWEILAREPGEARTWGVTADYRVTLEDGSGFTGWRYREDIRRPVPLWIAGAGHVAQAVAPLARDVGFAVTVLDDRTALLGRDRFSDGIALRGGAWEELLAGTAGWTGPAPFGLIVTRGHRHDALVLRQWVRGPFAFLGMIGSARKWRMITEGFLEAGWATREELARVACPVGLAIGAVSVPEIAVSVVAQLIERRRASRPAADETRAGLPA